MTLYKTKILTIPTLGLALTFASPVLTLARDDVPDEIAARSNPVTLEPREERYYKRQYRAKCARCHGKDGTGAGEDAGAQAVPPTDFTDVKVMDARSDGQLYYQILMGGGELCAMPAFGPESAHAWNDDKIWHMVAFVRLFARPSKE